MYQVKEPAVDVKEGVICKKHAQQEDYNPRSYCHSIISHPDHVCKKHICQKVKKIEPDTTNEDIVCIPHSTCKTKRFFETSSSSPDESDISKHSQNVSSPNFQKGRSLEEEYQSKTTHTLYKASKIQHPKVSPSSKMAFLGENIDMKNVSSKQSIPERNIEIEQKKKAIQSLGESAKILNTVANKNIFPSKATLDKNLKRKQIERTGQRDIDSFQDNSPSRANMRRFTIKGYDDNTIKLLKELTKVLGSEGITAISRLIRAELCPCCKCMICKCKIKKEMSGLTSAENEKKFIKQILSVDMAYSWAFDYFDSPDLETFEKERQKRFEKERLLAEEEEVSILIEEILKDEAIDPDEPLNDLQTKEIVQKIREMVGNQPDDTGSNFKSMENKFEERNEGSKNTDNKRNSKNKESEQPKQEKSLEHAQGEEYHHSTPNTQPSEPMKHGIELPPQDVEEAAIPINSEENPDSVGSSIEAPAHIGMLSSSRKPKRKKKLQKSLNESTSQKVKRMSYKESFTLSDESTQWNGLPSTAFGEEHHQQDNEISSQKSQIESEFIKKDINLLYAEKTREKIGEEHHQEDNNEIIPQKAQIESEFIKKDINLIYAEKTGEKIKTDDLKTRTIEKVQETEDKSTKPPSAIRLSSKLILALSRASAAAKMRLEARKSTLSPSSRHYSDVCNCLPGCCTCGSHYLFRILKQTTPLDPDRIRTSNVSRESSCLCYHSKDDLQEEEEMIADTKLVQSPRKKPFQYRFPLCDKKPRYEKTVIIVKPEAMKFKDVILRAIKKEGLDVIDQRLLHLTPEQVTEIYEENYGSAYFFMFVKQMSSTPIWVLSVAGLSAINRWKTLIGEDEMIHESWFYPESIKRRFGLHTDIYGAMKTSSDSQRARKDIRYFFPLDILEPISIDSIEVQDYCDKYIHPTLLRALYKIVREKPKDPLMYLANWVLRNNPNTPSFPDPLIALAPT